MKHRICIESSFCKNSFLSVIEEKISNKYRYFIGYRVVVGGEVKYIHRSGYFDTKEKAYEYLKGMDKY